MSDAEDLISLIDDDRENLQSLAPREAFEMWMQHQQSEKASSTLRSYRYRVSPFIDWLEDRGLDDLNDLTGREMMRFDAHERDRGLEQNTLNSRFGTIRLFLKFCVKLDAVPKTLPWKVEPPELSKEDRVNREKLTSERADELLENLGTYHYASLDHALVFTMWRTAARIGALHALDLDDVYLSEEDLSRLRHEHSTVSESVFEQILEEVEPPFLWFRHRPNAAVSTPLKKQYAGERPVNLSPEVGRVLRGYLRVSRPDVVEEDGREPFFASPKSRQRLSRSGMRNRIYRLTQPCRFGECPHGRDVEDCEAREHGYESRCPSSRSPHKLRTGSITWHRDRGVPKEDLAERANTSERLIEEVYDQPEALKRLVKRRRIVHRLEGEK